jgi:hypothetical protein
MLSKEKNLKVLVTYKKMEDHSTEKNKRVYVKERLTNTNLKY